MSGNLWGTVATMFSQVGGHRTVPQNLAGTMLAWAIGMGVRWDFERTLRDDLFSETRERF